MMWQVVAISPLRMIFRAQKVRVVLATVRLGYDSNGSPLGPKLAICR